MSGGAGQKKAEGEGNKKKNGKEKQHVFFLLFVCVCCEKREKQKKTNRRRLKGLRQVEQRCGGVGRCGESGSGGRRKKEREEKETEEIEASGKSKMPNKTKPPSSPSPHRVALNGVSSFIFLVLSFLPHRFFVSLRFVFFCVQRGISVQFLRGEKKPTE
eukprot:TRINITY_DN1479_c0_g3_i1.p3 TRINITY_DN1479_c0_g3~~TRINITY_DN1479_c0_g3_i1.p3  ORF type:complete len:159 (+),score=0.85 TRINITY_DN1479_c0_g3_i1:408-884(+)